ncbi:phosphonate ABC transporter, permease protein PhnE [Nocardia camponoti]|uniref:ABC transporter permease n=1 Tax=Nocardia camponoti TaxID=1616106 RepID=A0A917VDM2_9NOCA|nr:phosphonate ABC transporter, permease protein PhnE [Nocardia camponoti]GGK67252.1 ABC transporter permease [Nocardia camponoti]
MSVAVAHAVSVAVRPKKPRRLGVRVLWVAITAVVIGATMSAHIKWDRLADFPASLVRYLRLMFLPPDWASFGQALTATIESVEMAWLGTVLGIVVSFPLSFLAASGVAPRWVRLPMRGLFGLLRAVPEVVIAIIILSVTGLTPFTGALAIGIGSIGTLGKWGYESIENAERGPMVAALTCGASPVQVMRWGLWPTVAPEVFAFWLYRFEINVRASAVLGLIGAGGIGSMLVQNVQYRNWSTVGMLFIVVVVVTMMIDGVSGRIRTKIVTGRWRG